MKIANKTKKYQIIFAVVSIVMGLRCVGTELSDDLISSLSVSYRFGFVSKGFLGTIYNFICDILSVDTGYTSQFVFSAIVMFICIALYIIWGIFIIKRAQGIYDEKIFILLIFFTIWAMSIFTGVDYIGSAESVILLLMLWEIYFIITDSNMVVQIILPIAGVIVWKEFLFLYMGLIMFLLIYNTVNKDRAKYKKIAIICLIVTVGLYVYFAISGLFKGAAYKEVLSEFVRFPSVSVSIVRVIVMCVLLMPYIIFAVIFFRKILGQKTDAEKTEAEASAVKKSDSKDRALYYAMPFGALTVVPLFFMINNYGTFFFAIVAYYVLVVMALMLMGDNAVSKAFAEMTDKIKSEYKWLVILMLYAVLFTPIDSVKICYFVDKIF